MNFNDGAHRLIGVKVQGYLTFKEPIGKRQVSLPEGSSLQDLLAFLRQDLRGRFEEEAFNAVGQIREHVAILLNGVHYGHLPAGLNTILKDGDQVSIFPPISGGK